MYEYDLVLELLLSLCSALLAVIGYHIYYPNYLYTVHCTLYSDFGLSKKHMINYCIPVLKVGYTTLRTTFVVYRRI